MDLDLFNYAPMEAFSQLARLVKPPLPLASLDDRDRFFSWSVLVAEQADDGKRLLLQYPDGGLAWLHVDASDMLTGYSMISDAEARQIWPRLLLHTRPELREAVDEHIKAGTALSVALAKTFGPADADGLLELGREWADDGTETRRFLMPRGGVLEISVNEAGEVVATHILDGSDAWTLVQPVIDR